MKTALVDVIIPTYNGLPHLEEAVESVLTQTHADLVLHVIDDGSTDGTARYVSGLKDKRVRYLFKENGGLASARNYGITHSDAPFVAFLDADDRWLPHKLEGQLILMEQAEDLGLIYGHQRNIDEQGRVTGGLKAEKRGRVFDELLGGNFITGSGSMALVRREALDRAGLFREDLKIGEDWEMWLRIAHDYTVDFVDDYLAEIRVHPAGMQQNLVGMAEGLIYMLPIIGEEFELSSSQRQRLAGACLWRAAEFYLLAGRRAQARKALLKLLAAEPRAWIRIRRFYLYLRILLGNGYVTRLKRKGS